MGNQYTHANSFCSLLQTEEPPILGVKPLYIRRGLQIVVLVRTRPALLHEFQIFRMMGSCI